MRTTLGTKLYYSLFDDDAPEAEELSVKFNGRNPELIRKRDEFILYRIYHKNKWLRKTYFDALNELSDEVYLSVVMIQKILTAKSDDMLSIKKAAPTVRDLKEKYPHIVW